MPALAAISLNTVTPSIVANPNGGFDLTIGPETYRQITRGEFVSLLRFLTLVQVLRNIIAAGIDPDTATPAQLAAAIEQPIQVP